MLCPGWMLGVISGNAADTKGWDIANVFPGGGGNWGGSYLTVPAQGKNIEAAKKLAAWLTAPEQQLKAFTAAGTFPSQVDAYTSADLLDATNEYFNNAPTGAILIDRANAVTVAPYKGAKYFADQRPAPEGADSRRGRPAVDRRLVGPVGGRGRGALASSSYRGRRAWRRPRYIRFTHFPHPSQIGSSMTTTSVREPRSVARSQLSQRQRLSILNHKASPYLYISPFFILFAVVGLFPLIYTGWVSLNEWNLIGGAGDFVGFDNFAWVLSQPKFWIALRNTLSIFLLSAVPQIIIALLIAAVLDMNLRAKTFWRMGVLLPYIVAPVAAALIFGIMFADRYGLREQPPRHGRPRTRCGGTSTRSRATSRSPRWSTSAGPATTRSSCSPRCRRSRATTTRPR